MTIREVTLRFDDENPDPQGMFNGEFVQLVCDNFNALAEKSLVKVHAIVHDETEAVDIWPAAVITRSPRTRYELKAEPKDPRFDPETWTIRMADSEERDPE